MNGKEQKETKGLFPQMEERTLDFWQRNEIFKKSVNKEAPKGSYIFYDGPPFITGLPHYATLLPSIAKDVVPRYQTMKGHRVERVWGWDCHGLPAENKVEGVLGLKNKKDIEEMGVGKFIDACRDYVKTGSEQWRWYIDRIGRWVDMDNAYKTMDLGYMESVIWAFKELYSRGLIYEGYRTSLHCPRCATPLSKFEVTMDAGSYRDIEDETVTVKFRAKGKNLFKGDFYLLAWTTTPWTLPGNLALAVNKDIDYAAVESEGRIHILAEKKVKEFFEGKSHKITQIIKGKELAGLGYEPLFDLKNSEISANENSFKIYHADFVGIEEGTGIVHIAPNFGEEDFNLGKKAGLPMVELMDENGAYTDKAGDWEGYYFQDADGRVLENLGERIFSKEKYTHPYPFCYRCNTKLIHKTQKAWYLRIEEVRERMIESNKKINWVPEHFKEGRFKYNLESAPDWCLSRSRYWGSPIPVWKCASCSDIRVAGSIKEIEELSGRKIKDLHRPGIDEVEFKCLCGGKMKRVLEVLDVWFESGSMPFAQFRYPFERKDDWNDIFPADFIIEYTGQLRGWFYYLHVLGNALFDSIAFKNVVVTGVLAGTDGRKMSKSYGNYPDPKMVLDEYGSDSLRIYFMSSPIMLGGDMSLSEQDIRDALRKNVILLWNVVKFYGMFAQEKDFPAEEPKTGNALDRWILSRLNELIGEITNGLEKYDLPAACQPITLFIGDLSTWYIRRSRERFKSGDLDAFKVSGYVLFQLSKAIAPIMPFMAEQVWQEITGNDFGDGNKSVHLEDWPSKGSVDETVLKKMREARRIVELGLSQREENKIKIRQPLAKITVFNYELEKEYEDLIKEELNVKSVESRPGSGDVSVELDLNITKDLRMEGLKREIIRSVNDIRKKSGLGIDDSIRLYYETENSDIENVLEDGKLKPEIMKGTLAKDISKGMQGEVKKSVEINGSRVVFGITVL